jgi:flagellar biosynthesis GTPase FlhF
MKRLSPGVRFLLGFITFLLCLVLFVTAFAGILASNIVNILSSEDNLENLLRQVLFVDMRHPVSTRNAPAGGAPALRQLPVKTLSPADLKLSEQQTASSMVEWIYGALAEDFGDELNVDLETVKEFVERSTLDDFLVEKGADLFNDLYTGENTVTLGADEIREKLEENADLIEEYFGVPIDEQVIADVTATIEENEYVDRLENEGILNVILNPESTDSPDGMNNPNSADTQQIIDLARKALAAQTLWLFVGAILVLMLLILLVNMKQIWVGMRKIGITLMCAAVPFIILTVAVWVIPAGWSKTFHLPEIIEIVIREIVNLNYIICFSVFAFGLLMVIGGIIVYCIARRKYKKAQEQKKLEEKLLNEIPMPEVKFVAEDEAAEEEAEEEEAEEEEAPIEEEDTDEEASEEEIAEEEADEAASEEEPAEEEAEEETSEEETAEEETAEETV